MWCATTPIDPSDASVLDEYDGVPLFPPVRALRRILGPARTLFGYVQARQPLFGVCLGLQALAEVFGCTVSHAPPSCTAKPVSVDEYR